MDEAGQSSPSMGEGVNGQERSSAGKYHCPFLQHDQHGQHGQLSSLPKACQNKFESTTIKRLTYAYRWTRTVFKTWLTSVVPI